MNKLIISALLMVGLVGMIGTAVAYDGEILNEDGSDVALNPLDILPGQTIILSYYGDTFYAPALGSDLPYYSNVYMLPGSPSGAVSDIEVSFLHPNFTPMTDPDTDYGVICVYLNASAPVGAQYQIEIGAGSDGEIVYLDAGAESRNIDSIPEFPTVALPIAAVLGLMFIISSRKKKE